MSEDGYDNRFPLGLSGNEKAALMWKIEQDYRASNFGAMSFKDEYIAFAINFYTRNAYSLEDVTEQYRAHCNAERRRGLAAAFLADIQNQIRHRESETLM